MKRVLLFLTMMVGCFAAIDSEAASILWLHSISETAVVHDSGEIYGLDEYVENVLGASMSDVVYRIHVITSNTYMDFRVDEYYDDETGEYVPAGFGYAEEGNMAGPTGDGYKYVKLQQAKVGESGEIDWDDEVVVELGLMNDEWVFSQAFAFTEPFALDSIQNHTYEQGTLLPPVGDSQLSEFYTQVVPVPECDTVGLLIAGLVTMLIVRKRSWV